MLHSDRMECSFCRTWLRPLTLYIHTPVQYMYVYEVYRHGFFSQNRGFHVCIVVASIASVYVVVSCIVCPPTRQNRIQQHIVTAVA